MDSFSKKVKAIILVVAFTFIASSIYSFYNAQVVIIDDSAFPNDVVVNGPGFFPFSDSDGVFNELGQAPCDDLLLEFDGPDSLNGQSIEIGPAANGIETGPRQDFVINENGDIIVTLMDFPSEDPVTMESFGMGMGAGGISIVGGMGFSMGTFMVMTTINCGTSSSSTSGGETSTSSSSTSSGGTVIESSTSSTSSSTGGSSGSSVSSSSGATDFSMLTSIELYQSAITLETTARNTDLRPFGDMFSVTNAVSNINMSIEILNELKTRLMDSSIRLAMGMITVQEKIDSTIEFDNSALSNLDGVTEFNRDTSQAVNMARRDLKQARRCKQKVLRKLQREERQSNMSSMSSMSGMSGMSGMSSMSG